MALANPNAFRVNLADKMMEVAELFAQSGEQPSDARAWRHLLIYCPRELLDARIAELDRKRLAKIGDDIKNLTDIASSSGNYDCNAYMHGMANGLILAHSIVTGEKDDPAYLPTPAEWLDDKKGKRDVVSVQSEAGSIPQAQEGQTCGACAHEQDREARAGAGGNDPDGDQPRGGTPPDGALC